MVQSKWEVLWRGALASVVLIIVRPNVRAAEAPSYCAELKRPAILFLRSQREEATESVPHAGSGRSLELFHSLGIAAN